MKLMHKPKHMQLFVCDVDYADFCICTFATDSQNEYSDCGVHIERIDKNPSLWGHCIDKVSHFFKTGILPKLLFNWYTRPAVNSRHGEGGDASSLWKVI